LFGVDSEKLQIAPTLRNGIASVALIALSGLLRSPDSGPSPWSTYQCRTGGGLLHLRNG